MWSTSGKSSMVVVTYGPPRTTHLSMALHCRTTAWTDSFCTNMPVTNTTSAHSMSEDFNGRTFKSTKRLCQDLGSNAETVKSPSGGNAHRFLSKGSAWRKLQYVSGNSGFIKRT